MSLDRPRLPGDVLSDLHDRLIDANLSVLHTTSRVAHLERKLEAALAYLDNLTGPFADKDHIRDLLRL